MTSSPKRALSLPKILEAKADLPFKRPRLESEDADHHTHSNARCVDHQETERARSAHVADTVDTVDAATAVATSLPYRTHFASALSTTESMLLILDGNNNTGRVRRLSPKELQNYLYEHLNLTKDHTVDTWHQEYSRDEAFFQEIAALIQMMLLRSTITAGLQDSGAVPNSPDLHMTLLESISELTGRIIRLLPRMLKARLARQDSLEPELGPGSLTMPCLPWLFIFLMTCGANTPEPVTPKLADRFRKAYSTKHDLLPSLIEVLIILLDNLSRVRDVWPLVQSITPIATELTTYTSYEGDDLLFLIKRTMLPRMCDTLDGKLLQDIAAQVVYSSSRLIEEYTANKLQDMNSIISIYKTALQDDHERVSPSEARSTPETISFLCNARLETLPALFKVAWNVQVNVFFITSSNLDMQALGLHKLLSLLTDLYHAHRRRQIEESSIDYIARYLRTNEIPAYLFNGHFHPSLTHFSLDLFLFLIATENYTDLETDILWQVCMAKDEPDLVKARFCLLQRICYELPLARLRYVAELIKSMPLDAISPPVLDFLDSLCYINTFSERGSPDSRLWICVQLAIGMLNRMISTEERPKIEELCLRSLKRLEILRHRIWHDCPPHDAKLKQQIENAFSSYYSAIAPFLDSPDALGGEACKFLCGMAAPDHMIDDTVTRFDQTRDFFDGLGDWRGCHSICLLQCAISRRMPPTPADIKFAQRASSACARQILVISYGNHPALFLALCSGLSTFLSFAHDHRALTMGAEPENRLTCDEASILVKKLASSLQTLNAHKANEDQDKRLSIYAALLQVVQQYHDAWQTFDSISDHTLLHGPLLLAVDENVRFNMAKLMIGICSSPDAEPHVIERFWIIAHALSHSALSQHLHSDYALEIMRHLLLRKFTTAADMDELQAVAQTLKGQLLSFKRVAFSRLSRYKGVESVLLKLLKDVVTILCRLSGPSEVAAMGLDIFQQLLFPRLQDISADTAAPLIDQATRKQAFELIREGCVSFTDAGLLSLLAYQAVRPSWPSIQPNMRLTADALRHCSEPAGLVNLGNTCYVNSLIQQLYANVHFRKFIFDQQIENPDNQKLLAQMQHLFASLQDTPLHSISTNNLARSLELDPKVQDDVHVFFTLLMDRLESELLDNSEKQNLAKLFGGTNVTQIKGRCGHVSTCTESYRDISVTVKNKRSLEESLQDFVGGELMQGANQYQCSSCGSGCLVDAMRRTCLDSIPDYLNLCLKRFTWSATEGGECKINARFDFPLRIDMSRYTRAAVESPENDIASDDFDLVGVIVHKGTLDFGHYWSYVRLPCQDADQSIWYHMEDCNVQKVAGGGEEVQQHCAGDTTQSGNAYVLMYQRISSIQRQSNLEEVRSTLVDGADMPIELRLPASLAASFRERSMIQYHASHLLDPEFSQFVVWLLKNLPHFRNEAVIGHSDTLQLPGALVTTVAELTAATLLHVLSFTRDDCDIVPTLITAMNAAGDTDLDVSVAILSFFCNKWKDFHYAWISSGKNNCELLSEYMLKQLRLLRDRDRVAYTAMLEKVVSTHQMLLTMAMRERSTRWALYFGFMTRIGELGNEEAAMILDQFSIGHLIAAMSAAIGEMSTTRSRGYDAVIRRAEENKLDLSPIYELLDCLLDRPLQARECYEQDSGSRLSQGRICLTSQEWDTIYAEHFGSSIIGASRHCAIPEHWKDFVPGNLVKHLVRNCLTDDEVRGVLGHICECLQHEENDVLPWLYLILHCCTILSDSELVAQMLGHTGHILASCAKLHNEMLRFFRSACEIVPSQVWQTLLHWIPSLLTGSSCAKRDAVVSFLYDVLFEPRSPLEHSHLACDKINAIVRIIPPLVGRITKIHNAGRDLKCAAQMILVIQAAEEYCERWREEIDKVTDGALFEMLTGELNSAWSTFTRVNSDFRDCTRRGYSQSFDHGGDDEEKIDDESASELSDPGFETNDEELQ